MIWWGRYSRKSLGIDFDGWSRPMMLLIRPAAACLALAFFLGGRAARRKQPCRSKSFDDAEYTVCRFDPAEADMRIYWRNADGRPYGTFAALAADLADQGLRLDFGMNGGMYRDDLSPVGLLIENSVEVKALNTAGVAPDVRPVPNFYKKPNGVFVIGKNAAATLSTERYIRDHPAAEFATQSGPMLLVDGRIHPAFIVGSSDLNRRIGSALQAERSLLRHQRGRRQLRDLCTILPRSTRLRRCPLSRRRLGSGDPRESSAATTRRDMADTGRS